MDSTEGEKGRIRRVRTASPYPQGRTRRPGRELSWSVHGSAPSGMVKSRERPGGQRLSAARISVPWSVAGLRLGVVHLKHGDQARWSTWLRMARAREVTGGGTDPDAVSPGSRPEASWLVSVPDNSERSDVLGRGGVDRQATLDRRRLGHRGRLANRLPRGGLLSANPYAQPNPSPQKVDHAPALTHLFHSPTSLGSDLASDKRGVAGGGFGDDVDPCSTSFGTFFHLTFR